MILNCTGYHYRKKWMYQISLILYCVASQLWICIWLSLFPDDLQQIFSVFVLSLMLIGGICFYQQEMNERFEDENITIMYGLATAFLWWPITLIIACSVQKNKDIQSAKKKFAIKVLNGSIIVGIISYALIGFVVRNQLQTEECIEKLHPMIQLAMYLSK